MCILFIALSQHPDYPVIIAANRDEFHHRPTRSSDFWPEHPDLLAGKDLDAGGTWMGISRNGRIAALTNIRDPKHQHPAPRTRGELVVNFLNADINSTDYALQLRASKDYYNGYNLLFGDIRLPSPNLWVYNNYTDELNSLTSGCHGLSNASLNTPWPKLSQGVEALSQYCQQHHPCQKDALFSLLQNRQQAPDHQLPDTGVPLDWERRLSSIFIEGQDYGTRSSTLLLLNNQQQISWSERTYASSTKILDEKNFHFDLI